MVSIPRCISTMLLTSNEHVVLVTSQLVPSWVVPGCWMGCTGAELVTVSTLSRGEDATYRNPSLTSFPALVISRKEVPSKHPTAANSLPETSSVQPQDPEPLAEGHPLNEELAYASWEGESTLECLQIIHINKRVQINVAAFELMSSFPWNCICNTVSTGGLSVPRWVKRGVHESDFLLVGPVSQLGGHDSLVCNTGIIKS